MNPHMLLMTLVLEAGVMTTAWISQSVRDMSSTAYTPLASSDPDVESSSSTTVAMSLSPER